jgi:hypothetical protein
LQKSYGAPTGQRLAVTFAHPSHFRQRSPSPQGER